MNAAKWVDLFSDDALSVRQIERRDAVLGYATWAVLFGACYFGIGLVRRLDGSRGGTLNCAQMTRRGGHR